MLDRLAKLFAGLSAAKQGLGQAREALKSAPRQRLNVIDVDSTEDPRRLPAGRMVKKTVRTIEQRVSYIAMMAKKGREAADVREIAVKAVSRRCGKDWCITEGNDWQEVQAVFAELRKRYRYVSDPHGIDLFIHPSRTLDHGGSDCDDASILVCSCLGSIGFQTRLRVIQTVNAKSWHHIYALVGIPKHNPQKWPALDLSVRKAKPGWQPPAAMIARHRDFPVP